MEKYLKPERLDIDPTDSSASKKWEHWKKTFESFLKASDCALRSAGEEVPTSWKLDLLANHISSNVFTYISECISFESAIDTLSKLFTKPKNVIYARHALASRKQLGDETIDVYLQALKQLAKDCDFKTVDAETNKNDNIRDAFISGIKSSTIRQRLLENLTLTLEETHNQALSLEMAEVNASNFYSPNANTVAAIATTSKQKDSGKPILLKQEQDHNNTLAVTPTYRKRKCFFCGGQIHPRKNCPALDSICQFCNKKGHYAIVCRSKTHVNAASLEEDSLLCGCIVAASPTSLKKATVPAYIKGIKGEALIDTGSSISFINERYFQLCQLKKRPCYQTISMASTSHTSQVEGQTYVSARIGDHDYRNVNLLIVKNLCADLIIGHDILDEHSFLEFSFGGPKEPIKVCSVAEASVPAVPLFTNLSSNCRPIAIKSRRYSEDDKKFIEGEIRKLLADGIIEESTSPWRAQVLITKNANHKKRLVIDYSLTINRYTQLDAYPLPNMEDQVSEISKYSIFSAIDLQSAYHQVPILQDEKPYTAFEAAGNLYQFRRIPFGVTNGVSSFQRTIDWVIRKEKLEGTFAYLDDITVCGRSQSEHDANLQKFLAAAQKYGLTLNKEKSKFSQNSIDILGYTIKDHVIKPDAERLRPLLSLPPPNDTQSLRRVVGMFAHYSKWISNFSERIHALANTRIFPLNNQLVEDFRTLKADIVKSAVHAINNDIPFLVETDASEHSIAATLSQANRPVAFFSRTLNQSEQNHSAVEKEAYAIVESLKKWRHFLIGKPFRLVTDQRSVAFMFNNKLNSKIKNEKIQRWRLELAPFKYDIVYRPGKENNVADTLSRVCAAVESRSTKLVSLHEILCHPGVTRMVHWTRSKNLPYSIEEIRNMTNSCRICSELKPRYYHPTEPGPNLIKATSPFERLSIDFKGPVPSNTKNKYILTVIDEYSRFPFAFPCSDMSSATVIKNLNELFMIFGMPAFLHSDRGTSFLSSEVKQFLHSRGIATSRTTPYNPQGNGQVERLNSTLWKTIQLALRSRNLPIEDWERALNQALHSIRSLLCTATNCTPHERMFTHTRRSTNGDSIPTWLTNSEQVLMRRFDRTNKYQPIVEEVDLIQVNPDYSYVRLPNGRETTVSNRYLAPLGQDGETIENEIADGGVLDDSTPQNEHLVQDIEVPPTTEELPQGHDNTPDNTQDNAPHSEPRRPTRERRPPVRFGDYVVS